MLATWLLPLALGQEPAPAPSKPPVAAADASAAASPPITPWPDKQAKAALAEFQQALRGTPSMAEKSRALDLLAPGASPLLVKPLGTVVETDKSVVIRKRAAELLAQQPARQARPELLRLLRSDRVKDQPSVLAALVAGLSRCDYQRDDWQLVDNLFEKEFGADRVPLQEAILDLVARCREKQAIDLLLRHIDEPRPADVDDPANPPAEYWEARWKAWQAWRSRVKEALFALTGQRFSTASEAKAWLRKNPIE